MNPEPDVVFEWSDEKAASNLRKHGVSFEEAETAFRDPFARIRPDELHSEDEPRELLIGYANRRRLLIVYFIERVYRIVRIISARLANRQERRDYEETPRY